MQNEQFLNIIKSRRSIRQFQPSAIPKKLIMDILECGRWAPSGLNHQPWKIIVVSDTETKKKLAQCTSSNDIVLAAPHLLIIYLDQNSEDYSYVKNVQSIGALFENLLLAIHALGLGGVWLGEIYNNKEIVNSIFGITDPKMEFMGAIAFGYPAEQGESDRMDLSKFVTFWQE
jgi:nitroreductase